MDVKNGYLQGEVKLDIGSVCSDYSHSSKISHRSSQSTRKSARALSSISNRARRIKEYEDQGCTSLSVDLKPGDENNLNSVREDRSSSRISHRSTARSAVTTRAPSVQSSGWMKSVTDLDLSSRLMSSGLLRPQSSKSYTTLLQSPPKSNSKVKMPFKHNTNKPDVATVVVSPGREMSELTVLATSVINKVLKEQKPPKVNRVQGRLLKARLKPLDPVSVTSPTIQQCRGIIAETRAYGASSSRTFQRWKAIMSGSHRFIHPNVDLKDSMSMGESVHRTSQATSPVPSEDTSLEGGYDLQEAIKEDFENLFNTTISKSDELPALSDEGPSKSQRLTEVLPEDKVTVTTDLKKNTETKTDVKGDKESEAASLATVKTAGNKRPHSAFFPHDPFDPDSLRPKTTGDSIRPKSVRFADENKKPPDSSGSAPSVKKADEKEKKNKSKASCSPHSESVIRSHDPDDHNGSGPHDNPKFSYPDSVKANIGQRGSDSKQSFSNGNSNSPSDTLEIATESNSQLCESTEDKQILSMPKAASVLFETGNDPNIKQQQHTRNTGMNVKTHPGVKASNYKQTRKLPIGQSFASNNKEQKEKIHHTNSTLEKDSNLHPSNEKRKEPSLEFSHLKSENCKCNITHLPPKGSNVNLPPGHKKSLKKAPPIKERPFSASSYINKDIVERKPRAHSASKPARAADGNIFIERNGILSKHGLLGKKRPASAPSITSCNIVKNDSQKTEIKSKSCGTQLKEKPHKKTGKRRERDLTSNTDSAADVDKMWEELPEDDEDDFQDDLFLSKFKQLENELELNKAALHAEKLKCSMSQVQVIDSDKNLIEVVEPENIIVLGSSPVIIPGEILQEDDVDDIDEIACDGGVISESTLDQQPDEAEPVTTISCNLYKKTNLFVPISKRRQNNLKDSTRKNVRRASVPTSAVDETNNVSSCNHEKSVNRVENGAEILNEHVIESLCETAAALLQGSGETNAKDVIDSDGIQKQLKETRKQLELDYPHLTKHFHVSQSLGDKRVMANHAFQQASDPDILYQGDLYNSLLQAYRHHFDISNEENDDFDEGITTTSKKVQLHPKSELSGSKRQGRSSHHGSGPGLKTQDAGDYSNILEGSSMTKSRPWSGTTNDSGLEVDVLSNDDEDEIEAVNETTQTNHSAQNANTTEAHVDIADPFSNANKNQKTERPDSLTELGATSSALEVVAQAKKLSKSKKKSRHYEDMNTLSQVPPLCFRLNAKPPSGHLFYFAYDQNMSMDRMMTYLSSGEPLVRFWSLLFGFELVFNKKGVNSDLQDVGGFPNLAYNAKSSVEGCLYQLTPGQLECLDKFMGYPQNCDHIVLPVWMSNCTNPDDLGVAQYCVPACTYIAKDDMTWTTPIEPNDFALTQCIKAADLLTPSYRDHLATISKSLSSSSLFSETLAVSTVRCVA